MKNKALSIVVLSLQYGLMANPTNPQVTNGDVSFDSSTPGVLNIQASDRSIINWQDFSIDAGEMTQFFQPDVNSAVLNRVVSGNISSIMGSLQANGTVYLINPNGVIFGQDSVIDTGALLASTLDLPDQLFLQNGDLLFSGDSEEMLVNYGAIQASNGDVILIGYQVENNGTIDAPNGVAAVAAGREVLIRPLAQERVYIRLSAEDNTDLGINNTGDITALQAELKADGNAFSLAINHSGSIVATGMIEQGGKVFLVSNNGDMGVTGSIAASDGLGNGGEVGLFGGNIFMGQEGTVNVDGNLTGNGGTVMLLADGIANFYGSISAQGGAEGGDGGFIEVSGPVLDFAGSVCTMAPAGNTGMLLLDPNYITISSGVSQPAMPFISSYPPGSSGVLYNGGQGNGAPVSNLKAADLVMALTASNVTIQSAQYLSNNTMNAGNIDFMLDGAVVWSSPYSLTVQADNDINVQANILNFGLNGVGGSIFLNAGGDINIGDDGTLMTPVQVGSIGDTTLATTPVVALSAGRDVNVTASRGIGAYAQVGFSANVVNCDITVTTGGSVNLKAGTTPGIAGCFAAIGHTPTGMTTTLIGDITFPIVEGGVTLNGGADGDGHAQIGHLAAGISPVTVSGDIIMPTVQGAVTLNAGRGNNAFAMIAHGGHTTSSSMQSGSSLTGNIQILADSFALNGGNSLLLQGNGAFAAIGFTNGGTSDAGGISVNVPTILAPAHYITVLARNDIALTSGSRTNTNASIGALFANSTTVNNINVESISVNAGGNITLLGSTLDASALALIGATSNSSGASMPPANTVSSNVIVSAGGNLGLGAIGNIINVGPTKIQNGDTPNPGCATAVAAGVSLLLIANDHGSTSIFSTGDLAVATLGGDIDLISATTFPVIGGGTATIQGNGATTVISGGSVVLNDMTISRAQSAITTSRGNLTILAKNDVDLNPSSLIGQFGTETTLPTDKGDITITAATGDVNVLGKDFGFPFGFKGVTIQNHTSGDVNINAGRNVNFDEVVIQNPGNLAVGGGIGNFIIVAGTDINGNINVGTGTTTGGVNTLPTEVSQLRGNMMLAANGDLNVGSSTNTGGRSIIGDYRTGSGIVSSSLNITATEILGNVNLKGGSGANTFAQIGPNETTGVVTAGNFRILRSSSINLKAGTGTDAFAMIGPQAPLVISSIDLRTIGNGPATLTGGTTANAFAQVGIRSPAVAMPFVPEPYVNGAACGASGNICTDNGSYAFIGDVNGPVLPP